MRHLIQILDPAALRSGLFVFAVLFGVSVVADDDPAEIAEWQVTDSVHEAIPRPEGFPKVSCKEQWYHLTSNEGEPLAVPRPKSKDIYYNFESDSAQTPGVGNTGYIDYYRRVNRKNCYKTWTVLVYMTADNNLSPYALWDLYEMEAGYAAKRKAGSHPVRSDLLVQVDTAGNKGVRRLHMFQSPERYDPSKDREYFSGAKIHEVHSPIVAMFPENSRSNVDYAQDFSRFVQWGIENYPSLHYAVILWGHGQGWAADPIPASELIDREDFSDLDWLYDENFETSHEDNPHIDRNESPETTNSEFAGRFGGIGFDDSQKTYLGIPTLKNILSWTKDSSLGGRPIDVYASDACLMQMASVSGEITDSTRFIFGSAQLQNVLGLPYRRIMYLLNDGTFGGIKEESPVLANASEPELMGHMIPIQSYKSFKRFSQTIQGLQYVHSRHGIEKITAATLDSRSVESFVIPVIARLGTAIKDYLTEIPELTEERRKRIMWILQNVEPFQGGGQDLVLFLSLLEIELTREATQRRDEGIVPWATDAMFELAGKEPNPGDIDLSGDVIDLAKRAVKISVLRNVVGLKYQRRGWVASGFKGYAVWLPPSKREFWTRYPSMKKSKLFRYGSEDGVSSGPWGQMLEVLYAL